MRHLGLKCNFHTLFKCAHPRVPILRSCLCKVWLHRYCAGVPTSRFSDIAQSFVCIPCSLIANSSVVAELKNEVATLKAEVVQLRSALEIVNKKLEDTTAAQNKREREEWSTVVKRNPGRNVRRIQSTRTSSGNRSDRAGSGDNPTARSARRPRSADEDQRSRNNQGRVMVPGVRRVWGTFKHTPAGAVAATLKKLTTTGDRLTIKRVFRRGTAEGRDRWWFHLLGEEELLKQLEGEWESVSLQTCWKLEPCSKPARSEISTEHTNLNPTELEATAPGPEHSVDPAAAPSIDNTQSGTTTLPSSDLPDPESAPGSEDNGELVINSQNPNPTDESDNFLLVEGENQTQSN